MHIDAPVFAGGVVRSITAVIPADAPTGFDSALRQRRGLFMRILKILISFVLGAGSALTYTQVVAPSTASFWDGEFYNRVLKIEEDSNQSAEPYAIAFGASLTAMNFVPAAFMGALRNRGVQMRVYNLGILSANGHEVDYYLRKTIADLERQGVPLPEYVLIDSALPFTGFIRESSEGTLRTVEWHSLRETCSAIESLAIGPGSRGEKYAALRSHLSSLLQKYLPIGRAFTILKDPIPALRKSEQFEAGFHLFPPTSPGINRDRYNELVTKKLNRMGTEVSLNSFNLKALKAQIRYLIEKGITPVYFLPATLTDTRVFHLLAKQGTLPYLAAFDNPLENTEYWRIENRYDTHHLLSGKPSEDFTRELANDLYDHVFSSKADYDAKLRASIGE